MLQLTNKKIPWQLILVVFFGFGLLSGIIYKASHTSFTHDESYTYTHYVHQCFMDIISYKTPYLNNHILNSLSIKYSEAFFGSSELALRLGSVLAFVIYSTYIILLFYKYCPKFILPFYLLMTLNPYLLDFFALARGYGLSIAFMTMSIYYICIHFTSQKNKHLILFNVGAFLSVMSNFSMLNYYASALIVYNIISFLVLKHNASNSEKRCNFYKLNKINTISVILSGMILYEPLRRISKMSLLDFGGKKGFLEDTVSSVIYDVFYEAGIDSYMMSLKVFTILVFVSSFIIIIKHIKQKDVAFFKTHGAFVFVNLVLWCIVCVTNIQHFVLNNDFNMHRFALFLYPLFILNFVFLISYFYHCSFKKITLSISFICALLLLVNLYENHSLTYYKDWKWDKDTKLMMQSLVVEHEKNPEKQIRLGINWLLEPSTNFYRYTWQLNWLNPTNRKGVSKYDDYWCIFKNDKEYGAIASKRIIYLNEQSESVLLKNSD